MSNTRAKGLTNLNKYLQSYTSATEVSVNISVNNGREEF